MTFTVLARSEENGAFGIGIATYSLAVGGYCPFFVRGRGALSSQAFANPSLGPIAMNALEGQGSATEVLATLEAADRGFAYRQVAVLSADGDVSVHTGEQCRPWAGHETGKGFAAFGNLLAGAGVVSAIAAGFRDSAGKAFGERLLLALEAGRAASGQMAANGEALAERSAALIIRGADIVEDIDLRVDVSADALRDLRRTYGLYAPYIPYYALRARDPANTPPQDEWAREHLGAA